MKRISYTLSLFMAVFALAACQSEAPQAYDTADTYDLFGETLTPEGAVPVQAVVAEPATYLDQAFKVEGTVAEVCQEAGCWLTLQTDTGTNIRIHVARDDAGAYAFTMPKDISGRRVVVQGTLTETTLSEEMAEHYEEDGAMAEHHDEDAGHDEDAASRAELQMTASGVLVEKART